jgi:type III pantothenate kinase
LNLIVDIGNNSAKLFLFHGKQMILHTRKTGELHNVIKEWNASYTIEKAIISSVIDLTENEREAFNSLDCPVVWFNHTIPGPLAINYGTPETLGPDRLAAATGAWSEAEGKNLLVIDAGSAITIDFVDRNGNYHGGNISPGIRMRIRALHDFTDKLPLIEKEGRTPFLGDDTETAIRSGVINGICHEIEGYITAIKENYSDVLVFLTGGDENPLKNNIKSRIFADKYLVAKGLNRILLEYSNE